MLANQEKEGFFMPESTLDTKEHEPTFETEVVELASDGLGFGEGPISTKKQLKNPELSGLTLEVMRIGADVIKSGAAFVEVDEDANDDGCGDGRPTAVTYIINKLNGAREVFKRSRRRAKLFGGGLIAAASMFRTAIRGDVRSDETVLGDRTLIASKLDARNIHYGGHTDNHAHDTVSGCGAIDKYPQVTVNALKYRTKITNTMQVIYGDEEFERQRNAIDAVFGSYENQVEKFPEYFADAEGTKTLELMEQHGSVIKQLNDEHLEDFIVINDIENTTFDQRLFDEEMARRGVEGTAQAFVVDAWRGRMYADFIADIAEKEYSMDRQVAYQKAEADFWIRTLAVSATLTNGDLPVFLRRHKDDAFAA
jgi:hypothetical protein